MQLLRIASLLPLAGALTTNDAPRVKQVAIIGAGAGGSSAAYHLAQYAAEANIPTNITVFERNDYVGGRTTTVNPWDDKSMAVELGGSIFVSINHIMVKAMESSTSLLQAAISQRHSGCQIWVSGTGASL